MKRCFEPLLVLINNIFFSFRIHSNNHIALDLRHEGIFMSSIDYFLIFRMCYVIMAIFKNTVPSILKSLNRSKRSSMIFKNFTGSVYCKVFSFHSCNRSLSILKMAGISVFTQKFFSIRSAVFVTCCSVGVDFPNGKTLFKLKSLKFFVCQKSFSSTIPSIGDILVDNHFFFYGYERLSQLFQV